MAVVSPSPPPSPGGEGVRVAALPLIRRVEIVNLAPTGEGVSKTSDGVGFVAGALPGEDVDAEVLDVRKKFWKGRAVFVRNPSPLRRTGPHAEGCAGCDWSHYDPAAALTSKRALFLETMERIGDLPGALFGALPIEESALAYRLRNRFHASGRGESARIGYFAPGTHDVTSAEDCEALSEPMRGLLPRLGEAIAGSGAAVLEVATVESRDAAQRLARATLPTGSSAASPTRCSTRCSTSSTESRSRIRKATFSRGEESAGSGSRSGAASTR